MLKNILVITSPTFDDSWVDCLYIGLLRRGYNVHIYPYKWYYVQGFERAFLYVDVHTPSVSVEEIVTLCDAGFYDLLIVGFFWKEDPNRNYILRHATCPIVVFNSRDNPWEHSDRLRIQELCTHGSVLCEFRKEVLQSEEDIYPVSHPIESHYIEEVDFDKKYDVFAVYGSKFPQAAHHKRMMVCELIKDIFSERCVASYPANMPFDEFRRLCRKSWIGINVRGVGFQTARYFEIPAFGAALVSERLSIIIPNDFKEPEQVRFFDFEFERKGDWRVLPTLLEIIGELLRDKERLKEMIIRGHEHVKKYHTIEATTEYFLDIVQKHLG